MLHIVEWNIYVLQPLLDNHKYRVIILVFQDFSGNPTLDDVCAMVLRKGVPNDDMVRSKSHSGCCCCGVWNSIGSMEHCIIHCVYEEDCGTFAVREWFVETTTGDCWTATFVRQQEV